MARVIRPKDDDDRDKDEVVTPDVQPEPTPDPEPEENTENPYYDEDDDGEKATDEPMRLEDADPNQILWEGGPTVGDVIKLKEEHGDVYVTTVSLAAGKFVLWKILQRHEYRDIMRTIEDMTDSGQLHRSDIAMTQEELITATCALVPKMTMESFADDWAGIPSMLSQQILEASGFVPFDTRGL